MKQRYRARSSSLFLMELIFAILFFSIASAVCVKIFAASHNMSTEAQSINWAVEECSGIAEIICTSDSEDAAISSITAVYDNCNKDNLTIAFDEECQPCESKDAKYFIKVSTSTEDGMLKSKIKAYNSENGESIYVLKPIHYVGN